MPAALRVFGGPVATAASLLLVAAMLAASGAVAMVSSTGAAAARVHGAWWFDTALAVLGLQQVLALVARALAPRGPWTLVVLHAGVALLVAGALLSRAAGTSGRVTVPAGGTARAVDLDATGLRVQWGGDRDVTVALGRVPEPGPLVLPAGAPPLRLLEVADDAELVAGLAAGGAEDGPGVELRIRSLSAVHHVWLLADSPFFRRRDLGPVEVEHVAFDDAAALDDRLTARASADATLTLTLRDGLAPVELALPAALDQERAIGDVQVVVRQFLVHARLIGEQLIDDPQAPVNPAAIVTVRRGEAAETHTVFSLHPEFNLVGGRVGPGLVDAVSLTVGGGGRKTLVCVLTGPGGRHWVQLQAPTERGAAWPLAPGRSVVLGNLGLDIVLDRALPRAAATATPRPAAPPGSGARWLRVGTAGAAAGEGAWLRAGAPASWHAPDHGQVTVTHRPAQLELPFALQVQSLAVDLHPGSILAARYRGEVRLLDGGPAPVTATIGTDRSLDHGGFGIVLRGYVHGVDGGPDAAEFVVSRDPGAPLVRIALLLVVLGAAGLCCGRWRGRAPSGTHAAALLLATAALATPGPAQAAPAIPVEATQAWPIQADGRVQPLGVWAEDAMVAVTGRSAHDGYSPLDFVWGLHLAPATLRQRAWIVVEDDALKRSLGLSPSQRRFPYDELLGNAVFRQHVEAARAAPTDGVTVLPVARAALQVYERMERVAGLMDGSALRLLPTARGDAVWGSIADLRGDGSAVAQALLAELQAMAEAYRQRRADEFGARAAAFAQRVRTASGSAFPDPAAVQLELLSRRVGAFDLAAALYLAALAVLLAARGRGVAAARAGRALLLVALVLHTLGLLLRGLVAGRAPGVGVFEAMAVAGWGAVTFGVVLSLRRFGRPVRIQAAAAGVVTLGVAALLPWDRALLPPPPAFAHGGWLAAHTVGTQLGYGALLLAWLLAHAALGAADAARPLVRAHRLGVLLLAAGLAAGAMWAEASWGRLWEWDPKTDWALALLLVQAAIAWLHAAGRLAPARHALLVLLAFAAVLATWLLTGCARAPGLHARGCVHGAALVAVTWLGVEAVFLGWVLLRRPRRAVAAA